MKKLFTVLALLSSSFLIAQDAKLELTPSMGYMFSGRTNYPSAESDLKDAMSYSATLGVRIYQENTVDLMYMVVPSEINTTVYWGRTIGNEYRSAPMNVEYYHIGGTREFSTDQVRPITMFSLGATRFHPTGSTTSSLDGEVANSDIWAFSAALGGGAKILLSQRIGIRLNARLLMPMYFSGAGIYCGGGCGGGATFGVYFLQLDLSGGLVIGLGDY